MKMETKKLTKHVFRLLEAAGGLTVVILSFLQFQQKSPFDFDYCF